ncbi:MAG: nuclear transport factor 2 family protein [Gammaproteobacteria bacterium]
MAVLGIIGLGKEVVLIVKSRVEVIVNADVFQSPDLQSISHAMTRDSLGEAGKVVWDFLHLCAERRYEEANAFLVPGCVMEFPGGLKFRDCRELSQRSSTVYRWVAKVFERFEEYATADGTVVYNFGTLFGQWLDGTPFEGIRYIDRFVIQDGKIADQKVWNDLAVAAARR